MSYGRLRQIVGDAAKELEAAGAGFGSRILIRVDDDYSRLVAAYAAQWIGAVFIPINPAILGEELSYVIERSDPAAIVADPDLAEPFVGLDRGLLLNDSGSLERRRPASDRAEQDVPGAADPSMFLFTSGSSARPKPAVHSHSSQLAMSRDLAEILGVAPADRLLAFSPFFHVAGWSTAALPAIGSGASLVMPGRFSAGRFWSDVDRWRPTIWTTGLAFIEMVAARGGDPPARLPFRHVLSNLRPDTWAMGRDQLGLPLGTYYGMTENNGRGTIALDVDDYRPGFVGRPYTERDAVRVVDGNDRPVAPGEVGEIQLHGPCVMEGYFRGPEQTSETLRPGKWIATGDRGTMDPDGNVYFRGRLKNIIKRSGENISAEELEIVLLEHERISDAFVLAVPDRVREEEVKALVVDAGGSGIEPEDVRRHCAERVASFKVPRYVEFVKELPRTASGKPDMGTIHRTMGNLDGCWDGQEQRWIRGG